MKVKLLSCVRLLATPWTAAYQAPPPMGFSRQEYWSGVPLPSPKPMPTCSYLSQFSSVAQSCPTLCDPRNCSTPGLPVGEGNGTPFQFSCLENPMDGGAWWAAVHGVAGSRTRLSDFTFPFSLSCIGEGNGNPLQCSCLENPRGRRAWWADVYGVTQSRT